MELEANIAEMNFINCMTLSFFIVCESTDEVPQTFLTVVKASTIFATSVLICDTMVSDFFYVKVYFSRKRQKGKGILGSCLIFGFEFVKYKNIYFYWLVSRIRPPTKQFLHQFRTFI